MNYQDQVKQIEKLTKSIVKKSRRFAKNADGPYYIDLLGVIAELKDADNRLK